MEKGGGVFPHKGPRFKEQFKLKFVSFDWCEHSRVNARPQCQTTHKCSLKKVCGWRCCTPFERFKKINKDVPTRIRKPALPK